MTAAFPGRRRLWLLLAAFAAVWFSTLQYRSLVRPDEGRYAEIAREMAVSGDWVTPRLNGLKYFEKPPLQYWATAAAFEAFGAREWTARLWPAATGFACVLVVFFTGRRLFGERAGLAAAAVCASSLFFAVIGHINTLDMGLAFFLQLAVSAYLFSRGAEPARARGWMLLAWAALALALLTKGLVALVLPGATLACYALLKRDAGVFRRLNPASGLALLLLLAAPWFVAVSAANPEFPRFFFIHEHFERFLTKVHGRYQPAWYFVPVFLVGALPWSLLKLHAAAAAWRADAPRGFAPRRFLVLWCAIVFVFFSASDSKLPSYILPLFPAAALLVGAEIERIGRRAFLAHLVPAAAAGVVLLGAALVAERFGGEETPAAMLNDYKPWLAAAALVLLAGSAGAAAAERRGARLVAVLVLAAAGLAASLAIALGHESLGRSNSAHYIAGRIAPWLRADIPFYSVRMYEQTLPFYIGRTVILVDYRDEMGFGLDQEPWRGIPTLSGFLERWREDREALAIMTPSTHAELLAAGLPMQVIARDTRRIIVRKP
ncbi:MAG: glycosyltransferase family 39 protein [Rhodocyclaceae bacterium]